MTTLSTNETLVCDLSVFTSDIREAHIDLAIKLRKAVIGMEQDENGFRVFFHVRTDPDEILAFAKDEQRCCGFLKEAEVYRETDSDKDRIMLSLLTSAEGASAWTAAFFALAREPLDPTEKIGRTHSNRWAWPAVIGALMCMACVLPIIGTMLIARGLIPAHWNVGEMTYLIAGAAVIALWFFVKWLRRSGAKNSQSNRYGC
ncbi:hypothetical protein TDB9533_00823 [Thalassocella blandensis]|nr:hypothetical protein TDB9533_00823 [Thalassocella blandensis]